MMKKIIKNARLFIFATAIIFSIIACATTSPSLVGNWVLERVEGTPYAGTISRIEFFEDGTGNMEGSSLIWKVENDRLTITAFDLTSTDTFKLSGNSLTITTDDGSIRVFKRAE